MRGRDLVGFTEVVALLRVPERTAARYVRRPDFPAPLARLAAGPIWRRGDVELWARQRIPMPRGRPPKGQRDS